MAFSILFNDLWSNYKAISAIFNVLITHSKIMKLTKKVYDFLQKVTAFSVLFNDPWGNYKTISAVMALITKKLQKFERKFMTF